DSLGSLDELRRAEARNHAAGEPAHPREQSGARRLPHGADAGAEHEPPRGGPKEDARDGDGGRSVVEASRGRDHREDRSETDDGHGVRPGEEQRGRIRGQQPGGRAGPPADPATSRRASIVRRPIASSRIPPTRWSGRAFCTKKRKSTVSPNAATAP